MMIRLVIVFALLILYSCSPEGSGKENNQERDEIKKDILSYEDSLSKSTDEKVIFRQKKGLINTLETFYRKFRNDKSTPRCLEKIQMFYSSEGNVSKAVQWADTLLIRFPKYENRLMILESQIANFDMFVKPRDTVKIRYYFQKILQENPGLPIEKKKDIQERLKHLSLTFDEFIEFRQKK